jgi:aquaporin Z
MDLLNILVEIIGTFFFLTIILNSLTDSSIGIIGVGIGLVAALYMGSTITGSHYLNPAISFAMFMKDKIGFNMLITYVLAQLVGAALAVKFNTFLLTRSK